MKPNVSNLLKHLAFGSLMSLALCACSDDPENEGGGPGTAGDENALYVAPNGKDVYPGTLEKPMSIHAAASKVRPGQTIYVRGGTYTLLAPVELTRFASATSPVRLWAYEGEKPVFDCSQQPSNVSRNGFIVSGEYWHIKGLEVTNAHYSGFSVGEGSHNTFEQCVAHHNGGTGFHIGFDHNQIFNENGEKAAYNTFLNCDSYNNFDWYATNEQGLPAAGTNTDGFEVKSNAGKGNRFIGCRAWSNSDDNWDFFECGYGIELIDCWCWNAGVMDDHKQTYKEKTGGELTEEVWDGNGNGFKIGGGCGYIGGRDCQLISRGTHVVRGCIAFNNNVKGFDQNDHEYGAYVENCLGFGNQINFKFYAANREKTKFVFHNNISFGGEKADGFDNITYEHAGNLWDQPGLTDQPEDEFVSLDPKDAAAERGADGSLPARFGRLKAGSVFVDKGVPTASINLAREGIVLDPIAYRGQNPDLGAFELQ